MTEPSGNGNDDAVKSTAKVPSGRTRGLRPPWRKGQSGNPGGRPKGHGLMPGIIAKLDKDGGKLRRELEQALIRRAKQGDQRILAMLLDRLDGPVRQELAHTIERQVKLIEGVSEDAL